MGSFESHDSFVFNQWLGACFKPVSNHMVLENWSLLHHNVQNVCFKTFQNSVLD